MLVSWALLYTMANNSPCQVQHSLHHVGAILGAGLTEQGPVGLGE